MNRPIGHIITSWLCLLLLGLGCTIPGGALVLCQHADGSMQIELAPCDRDEGGVCIQACRSSGAQASEDGLPSPCKDTMLKHERQLSGTSPRLVDHPTLVFLSAYALVTCWGDEVPLPHRTHRLVFDASPPDSLSRLRTIILLV